MRYIFCLLFLSLMAGSTGAQSGPKSAFLTKLEKKSKEIKKNQGNPEVNRTQGLAGHERPDNVESPVVNDALSTLANGDKEVAINDLNAFMNSDVSDTEKSDAAYGLGLAYYESGRLEEAVTELKRAIELDPNQTDALYVLGMVYDEQGEFDSAAETYLQLIELNEANGNPYPADAADAWYELGRLLYEAELPDEAGECLNMARELNPEEAYRPYDE